MAELLLRATAALAIVSGLIYLSGHLLKKAQAAGLIRAVAGERRIKLLETARLGPDSYLHLVQVDDGTVLVATGRGGVAVSASASPSASASVLEAVSTTDSDAREVSAL